MVRLDYFNRVDGRPHGIEIKSRIPFSYSTVEFQGNRTSLGSVPDYSLWYGSEERDAVQLVVFETRTNALGCGARVKVCPSCEAQVMATMGECWMEGGWKLADSL